MPAHYAVGLSTNDPNRFQCYHAAHVLIIADEAQGILSAIWEAVEGIRAGGDVRVLVQGNPTVTGGHYHDAFGRNRGIWKNVYDFGVRYTKSARCHDRAAIGDVRR